MNKNSKPSATGTAKQFNEREGVVSVCQCKSGCSSNKCKCFKLALKCAFQCHNGENCDNKGTNIRLAIIFIKGTRMIIACMYIMFIKIIVFYKQVLIIAQWIIMMIC